MKRESNKAKYGSMERWLITYADLITLLLIFFIVMYALSQVDVKKFQMLAESLNKAMGGGSMIFQEIGPSMVPGISGTEMDIKNVSERIEMEDMRQELTALIKEMGLSAKVSVTSEERGIVLSFQEGVLFKIGSAELTPQAKDIIIKVAPLLMKVPNYVRVEGHTCNLPIYNEHYKSNWELSSARALTTVQELITSSHFPPERLSAVAYGEYRPRVPNTSEANRQLNRRVDIVILRSKFKGAEPGITIAE